MNPRQLTNFLRIAELRSFTKAAAVLHIAQPALSRQVQQLEDDLGVRLFVRSDSGVTLTEAGDALRTRAASLLQHFANVRDEVSALSDLVQGRLHFGMPPSLFDLATMPLLLAMRERYASVQASVIEGVSSAVYELVLAGRLDFGVVLSTESTLGLHHRELFRERLFLARPIGTGPSDRTLRTYPSPGRWCILANAPSVSRHRSWWSCSWRSRRRWPRPAAGPGLPCYSPRHGPHADLILGKKPCKAYRTCCRA